MTSIELRNKGIDVARAGNYKLATSYLKKAIKLGNTTAINDMGVVEERKGNHRKALDYYQQGIEFNIPVSWSNIANFYKKGIVVKKDIKKAIQYYEKAGELGFTDAYYDLYLIYLTSEYGVKKNHAKAIRYLEIGAEKQIEMKDGSDSCIVELDYNLTKGRYVRKSEKKAFSLISRAESIKTGQIQYNLGSHYMFGGGTKKDIEKAIKLLTVSYQHRYWDAYLLLAKIYAQYRKDFLLAYFYLRRGMEHNSAKCAIEYIKMCFSEEIDNFEFNRNNGIVISHLLINFLYDQKPDEYIDERRDYEELKKKYADKCNFERLELDVIKHHEDEKQPKIVA